jgi:hypothetical protein
MRWLRSGASPARYEKNGSFANARVSVAARAGISSARASRIMGRLWPVRTSGRRRGIRVALAPGVERSSVDLKLRVILVTTRAALRHADSDPAQRQAIVERGRSLLEALASEEDGLDLAAIDAARAEMDGLVDA